jgi:hypothetical protein
MTTFRFVVGLLLILTVVRCDLEKFTGYNYEGESLVETARITGKVTNIFTGTPILRVTLKFGNFTTYTDGDGNYLLVYPLATDDERDRPISVVVSRPDYFPQETEIVVYPDRNIHDFALVYAAPIIESSSLEFTPPSDIVCYATILDYQGVDDIEKVEGIFTYESEGVQTVVHIPLDEDVRFSGTRARFKSNLELITADGTLITKAYQIMVLDKEGFSDTQDFIRPQ